MSFPILENIAKTPRHTTFYLSCGSLRGTPIIFVHGWPELSISWRHQLRMFGALGFYSVAPDMRGYGPSSIYMRHEDYALREIVADMIELLAAIGASRAIWVGHDWVAPVGLVNRSRTAPSDALASPISACPISRTVSPLKP